MAKFMSAKEAKSTYKKRSKKISKLTAVRQAATEIHKYQKQRAPVKTGETVNNLIRRKINALRYIIKSDVRPKGRTGFKQNVWSNRANPHMRPRMVWNMSKPTLYGDGTHRITGVPGWFSLGEKFGKQRFPELAIKEVRKILKEK